MAPPRTQSLGWEGVDASGATGEMTPHNKDRPLKLLILGKYYAPVRGGIETHTRDLALAVGEAHEVRVLVHNEGPETVVEHLDGVELVRAATVARPLKQPISPSMFRLARAFNADIVHLHAPNVWATAAALFAAPRGRLIITHHADIVGREPVRSAALILYRFMARRAAALIVSASNNYRFSKDLKGVVKTVYQVPFCLQPSPRNEDPDFRAEALELKSGHFGDHPVATFIGRLVPYKGLDRLITALANSPRTRLVIMGKGPLEQDLRSQAARLGVTDRILFAGGVDDRTKDLWLAACDLFVLPSVTTAEAFGIVQIEAMLWGKPVITTDLESGVPQVGEHGVTSLVVPPDDVPALTQALARLSDDPALRDRMGQAGAARARELYSPARFRQTMLDLYARVANGT